MGMYGREMKVTVRTADLREILTKNKAKHIDAYQAAVEGYRKQAMEALQKRLAKMETADKPPSLSFKMPKPESHEKDYDRALGMLKLHANDTLVLDTEAYQKFVEDDWDWKHNFENVASSYVVAED